MIRKRLLPIFFSLLILVTAVGAVSAQSSKEAEGRAAEQAGKLREALTHYVAALQTVSEGSADDQRLRETIIKLVQKLSPSPAVPEEAERRMARGRAAVKAATDEQGFLRAANEFSAAVKAAPWLADGYFNLGIVLDKAGKQADAIRNLKLYMIAAPNAPDAKQVRDLMFEIEYRQEEAQRAKAEAERKAAQQQQAAVEKRNRWLQQLAGRWMRDQSDSSCKRTFYYQLTASGSRINLKWLSFDVRKISGPSGMTCGGGYFPGTVWVLEGSLDDQRVITGSLTHTTPVHMMAQYGAPFRACASKGNITLRSPVTGSISEDGTTMAIKFNQEEIDTTGRCEPNGRYETNEFSFQRER